MGGVLEGVLIVFRDSENDVYKFGGRSCYTSLRDSKLKSTSCASASGSGFPCGGRT